MNRRNWIKVTAAVGVGAIASAGLYSFSRQAPKKIRKVSGQEDWLFTGHSTNPMPVSAYEASKAEPAELRGINFQSGSSISVRLPFLPHDIVSSNESDGRVACALKWGNLAALVDIKSQKIEKLIEAPAHARFFGHLAWSHDSKNIFFSCENDTAGEGQLWVYDVANSKFDGHVETGGYLPHQVRLSDDATRLHILNASGRRDVRSKDRMAMLNDIDLSSGKITKKREFRIEGFNHFSLGPESSQFLCGGVFDADLNKESTLTLIDDSQSYENSLAESKDFTFKGETLSLVTFINEHGNLGLATIPNSNAIILYDFTDKRILHIDKSLINPRGLSLSNQNPNQFYVNLASGDILQMTLIKDRGGYAFQKESSKLLGNGSHLQLIRI